MHRQFEEELEEIKHGILAMAGLVEKCLDDVAVALADQNSELAEAVIAMDEEIDQHEVAIDRLAIDFNASLTTMSFRTHCSRP